METKTILLGLYFVQINHRLELNTIIAAMSYTFKTGRTTSKKKLLENHHQATKEITPTPPCNKKRGKEPPPLSPPSKDHQ